MTPAELRAATRRAIYLWGGMSSGLYAARAFAITPSAALDAIEAAIDAEIAAARPQWQPIETAPRDESAITGGCWAGARWLSASVFWHLDYPGWYLAYTGLSRDRIPFEPTHWMPRPDAPEPSKEGES